MVMYLVAGSPLVGRGATKEEKPEKHEKHEKDMSQCGSDPFLAGSIYGFGSDY
jgi:hypothetical protein